LDVGAAHEAGQAGLAVLVGAAGGELADAGGLEGARRAGLGEAAGPVVPLHLGLLLDVARRGDAHGHAGLEAVGGVGGVGELAGDAVGAHALVVDVDGEAGLGGAEGAAGGGGGGGGGVAGVGPPAAGEGGEAGRAAAP